MESTTIGPSNPTSPTLPPTCLSTTGRGLAHRAETEQLGERIATLAAQISAATYQLLLLIREFDQREGWGAAGARSCAHWLSWRTGVAMGAAREKVRVARALADLPEISDALSVARISYSKARALTRIATPENENRLLDFSIAATASQVETFVRAWRRVDRSAGLDAELEREAQRHASRYLHVYPDDDGMVVVRGRLEPEAGAAFMRALAAASESLYNEQEENRRAGADGVNSAQRRADAAGRLAEAALGSGLKEGSEVDTRADRYQVVLHVDEQVLADPAASGAPEAPGASEIEDTGNVSAETSRRIACDAATVTMTHDSEGRVLDVGRKTRVISPALRRALKRRDETCRFPGCDLKFCDAHHVRHWADGGETRLDNLVLLCRKHHRSVHEEGFRVEPTSNGGFRFARPDGRAIEDAPMAPRLGEDPMTQLIDRLVDAGLEPGELDHHPEWDGSSLDLAMAIDVLWSPRPAD